MLLIFQINVKENKGGWLEISRGRCVSLEALVVTSVQSIHSVPDSPYSRHRIFVHIPSPEAYSVGGGVKGAFSLCD